MPDGLPFSTALVSAMAQPAALLGPDGVIQAHNDGLRNCVSENATVLVGQSIATVVSSQDVPNILDFIASDGQTFSAPVTLQSGHLRLLIEALRSEGTPTHYLCQFVPDIALDSSRLRFLLEHLDQGVWHYNVLTETFTVTDAWYRMRELDTGQDRNVSLMNGRTWLDEVHPDDRAALIAMFSGQTSGDTKSMNIQYRRKHPDGRWVWILSRSSVMSYDQNGGPVQIVGLDTDITDLKASEVKLSELAGKTQLAIDVSAVGVWEFDSATGTVHWDDRLLEIYGLDDGKNTRAGHLWETYLHPDDRAATVADADLCLAENRDFIRDYRIVWPSGEIRHLRCRARFVAVSGTAGKMIGVNIDITDDVRRAEELEAARAQLEHDSRHDALTGLANRRLLDETTAALLARLTPDQKFAVLHIDLDHFKKINDTMGHAAGDAVLVQVAQVLQSLVQDDGLVCRNGGDEFVVLLYQAKSRAALGDVCQSIIDRVSKPVIFRGQPLSVGLSIGAAIGHGGVQDASEVFIQADVALYDAKSEGRSRYQLFRPGITLASQSEVAMRHQFLDALENCELTCHYQPQFDAKTYALVGAEALVRWNCPKLGLMLPDQFMPMAHKAGLVPKVDDFVFHHVLEQQTRWAEAGLNVPTVSLNISRERLEEEGLVSQIISALEPHHDISFELLETSFLDDANKGLMRTLDAMRAAGISLALDDFGSGHSSIVALQTLRPDRIKIDRRLVAPLSQNNTQILTLQALTRLATLDGAGVIVEGIETQSQLDAMRQLDCEALQGFALARPMTAEDFTAYLKTAAPVGAAVIGGMT